MAVTMEQVRAAKQKFKMSDWPGCNGVGIGRATGGAINDTGANLAVCVSFERAIPPGLPTEIDGVPVVAEVVGPIVLL